MSIDGIYHAIAQDILKEVGDDWVNAIINYEDDDDSGEFDCTYENSSGQSVDFDINFSTFKRFKELHKITTEGGSNRWNRAKFTLYSDGKFNIDFEWDQSLADEIESNS